MAAAKRSVLSSLAVYAEDSDPESDSEAGTAGSDGGAAAGEKGGLVSVGYGDDDFTRLDGDEEGYEEEDDENSRQSEDDDSETEKPEAGDLKEFSELEKRDPQELVGQRVEGECTDLSTSGSVLQQQDALSCRPGGGLACTFSWTPI